MKRTRCSWGKNPSQYRKYHDEQWGVPLHDDKELFEMLSLELNQAGLSWLTILNKREHFKKAFADFEIAVVGNFSEEDIERLLQDEGIIRNRLKIHAVIHNAKRVQEIQREFGSFDAYIWHFVEGVPLQSHCQTEAEVPSFSDLSEKMSKDMKKRGFKFVGKTIVYSFMQAIGMVNDHVVTCFRYKELLP